jgi:hypothetical protein
MRWIKVLAVAVAVLCVFIVISAVLRILFLIGIGFLIAVAFFAASKGWERYKLDRQHHQDRRQERRARPNVEPPRQRPTGFPSSGTAGFDVDEELARLRRERPGS